jgi:hypothetical protein
MSVDHNHYDNEIEEYYHMQLLIYVLDYYIQSLDKEKSNNHFILNLLYIQLEHLKFVIV